MTFREFLERNGCTVDVTQENDGSGYVCYDVTLPDGTHHDVTVTS